MKTEKTKKRILFLLSCLLVQSRGEVGCKKGFKGRVSTRDNDDIKSESCPAGSLCGRFEVANLRSEDGM